MFVGIKIQYVYGISGNELPPPITKTIKTAHLIDVDTKDEAMEVMKEMVLPLRQASKDSKPYSAPDGYDWEVIKIA